MREREREREGSVEGEAEVPIGTEWEGHYDKMVGHPLYGEGHGGTYRHRDDETRVDCEQVE